MSTHATVLENESPGRRSVTEELADAETLERRVARTERRRIDVSDLNADSLVEFVEENVGTHLVSLEHRGARTYLVLE